MMKFLSKALLFQWFYISKWIIGILLVIWGGVVYITHMEAIEFVSRNISSFTTNTIGIEIQIYQLLIVIAIFLVYIFTKGVNKRGNYTFLTSGPFNKRKIYLNDLIALSFVLILFIIVFLYISVCIYIKYGNQLYLINGYWLEVFLSTVRMMILGFAFIVYLVLFDHMFTNIVLAGAALIGVPLLSVINISWLVGNFNTFFNEGNRSTISDFIFIFIEGIRSIIFDGNYIIYDTYNGSHYVFIGAVIILVCAVLGFILIDRLSGKIRIETMNKIFSFPWVEKYAVILISLSFAQGIFTIIFNSLTYNFNINIVQSCILGILSSIIIYVLSYKLIKYIIKIVA